MKPGVALPDPRFSSTATILTPPWNVENKQRSLEVSQEIEVIEKKEGENKEVAE